MNKKINYKKLVLIIIPIIVIGLFASVFMLSKNNQRDDPLTDPVVDGTDKEEDGTVSGDEEIDEESHYITAAAIGLDKGGYLTDVMMVGVFNTKTYTINVFSVPRDTKYEIDDELYETLNEKYWSPRVMKLNALHSWAKQANMENPEQYTLEALEEITGLEIDHYAIVDTNSFDKVVDAMGGVELYVPRDMNYTDDEQGLYINLKQGTQVLDGDKAEQFVRYRADYPNGDIDRVQMQQYFIKGFVNSLLKFENIFKLQNISNSISEMITTDITKKDIVKYMKYYDNVIKNIKQGAIKTYTIPGVIGDYYEYESKEAVHEFIQSKLNEVVTTTDSKSCAIEILNGGHINGLAEDYRDKLKKDGYQISSVGNSKEKIIKTKIITNKEGIGQDLEQYFNLVEFVYDPSRLPENIDIQIILGNVEE